MNPDHLNIEYMHILVVYNLYMDHLVVVMNMKCISLIYLSIYQLDTYMNVHIHLSNKVDRLYTLFHIIQHMLQALMDLGIRLLRLIVVIIDLLEDGR